MVTKIGESQRACSSRASLYEGVLADFPRKSCGGCSTGIERPEHQCGFMAARSLLRGLVMIRAVPKMGRKQCQQD
jgi:hypothetical protein